MSAHNLTQSLGNFLDPQTAHNMLQTSTEGALVHAGNMAMQKHNELREIMLKPFFCDFPELGDAVKTKFFKLDTFRHELWALFEKV